MNQSEIVITYGRYNPPTIGHQLLFNSAIAISIKQNIQYQAWVSHTINVNNPLPILRKLYYLTNMFNHIGFKQTSIECPTIITILKLLNTEYSSVILVVGGDRLIQLKELINKYNGIEYQYEDIQVVNCGYRNDTIGIESISATLARSYVKQNKFDKFCDCMPIGIDIKLINEMWNELRVYYER